MLENNYKTPVNIVFARVCCLMVVAGTGLEPVTFGL